VTDRKVEGDRTAFDSIYRNGYPSREEVYEWAMEVGTELVEGTHFIERLRRERDEVELTEREFRRTIKPVLLHAQDRAVMLWQRAWRAARMTGVAYVAPVPAPPLQPEGTQAPVATPPAACYSAPMSATTSEREPAADVKAGDGNEQQPSAPGSPPPTAEEADIVVRAAAAAAAAHQPMAPDRVAGQSVSGRCRRRHWRPQRCRHRSGRSDAGIGSPAYVPPEPLGNDIRAQPFRSWFR